VIIHQSDLSTWARCPQALFLQRSGNPGIQTSALSFGTVMHYALEVFEREFRTGDGWAAARRTAIDTFTHYWHPANIEAICPKVEVWLRGQTWGGLNKIGQEALAWYADWAKEQDETLLATEYGFQVPIEGTWDYDIDAPHILAGSVDRLSYAFIKRQLTLSVDDYKSGKDYVDLRQNVQFTAYLYASTRKEFWAGWNGEDGFGAAKGLELHRQFASAYRRGRWIGLKKHKVMDAGYRGPDDYDRFALAVDQVAASMKANIYPLHLSGENCTYCNFREICAGVGVPTADHGAPPR
jgi:ATP-dependent helicase/DNAse subunit B